jgi:hypothetical protein
VKIASYQTHRVDGDYVGHAFELYASMDRVEQIDHAAKMRAERWSDSASGAAFVRAFHYFMRRDNPPRGPYRSAPR